MDGHREVVGRRPELEQLTAFFDRMPDGHQVLALTGPAGIGKTTLWRHGAERAAGQGRTVLSARPSGAEARLSFAGLADLLETVDEGLLDGLPPVQRRALDVALLRDEGDEHPVDDRVVASGLLSLLRALAAVAPVLVAVDDAQWLDAPTAGALAFALRRLAALPVGVLASIRTDGERPRTFVDALPGTRGSELVLGPLSVAAIHAIVQGELGRVLPRPTLVRVAQASGGNPFYAVEIARELFRLEQTAPSERLPVPAELQTLLRARVERLPPATRDALLSASCLGAPRTGIVPEEPLAPAEEAGVVRIAGDGRIRFEHPLLAAAVYESASTARRRTVHAELARRVADPEERARHLALAARGTDAAIAGELEHAARLAAARGASDSAAELTELALRLTPATDAGEKARRGTELGNHLYAAGNIPAAIDALERATAIAPPGDERCRAMIDLGAIYTVVGEHARGVALIDAALERIVDPLLAAQAHARRAWVSQPQPERLVAHCRQAVELVDEQRAPDVHSFALQHLAYGLLCMGRSAEHELVERSLPGQEAAGMWTVSSIGPRWPMFFDDFATARERHVRLLARADEQGNEPERQSELAYLALIELWSGHPDEAESLAREALALADQIEQEPMACVSRYALSLVEALRGRVDEATRLAEASLAWTGPPPHEETFVLATQAYAALGFVALSRDDLAEADRVLTLADEASARWPEPAPFRFHADHAEAVIRLGDLERGEALVARLERRAATIPRPWICAVSARCRGLLQAAAGELDAAQASLDRALELHAALEMPFEHARTLLCAGELRRRRKEKRLARIALEQAAAELDALGAPLWAARARDELARVSTRRAPSGLTATEERIATLAAEGLTNRAIAERAFVSVSTVEANLKRVYRKLGISSRARLARALDERGEPPRSHPATL